MSKKDKRSFNYSFYNKHFESSTEIIEKFYQQSISSSLK